MENNYRLIEILIKGRDSTKRLQNLLHRGVNLEESVSAEDLSTGILESFSGAISILDSSVSGEAYGFPASPDTGLTSPVEQMPEAYTRKKPAPGVKGRRGCYKRRKTVESSVKISDTTEDEFAWRKYGQKEILNSKSPRCYFRCTHKNVHGCKALKQVQKLEDESNMYRITYLGRHTCPMVSHHQLVLDFEDFKTQHHVPTSPSTITNIQFVKQEVDSKDQSTDLSENVSSANDENSSRPLRWNDILRDDIEDSCASTVSHGYPNADFLINDFFRSDGLLDQVFSWTNLMGESSDNV